MLINEFLETFMVVDEEGRKVPISEEEQINRMVEYLMAIGFKKELAPGSKTCSTWYLISKESDAVLIISDTFGERQVASIVEKDFVMKYMKKSNDDLRCLIRKTGSYENERIDLCFSRYEGKFNVKVYRVIKALAEGIDFNTMGAIDHELNNIALNLPKFLRFADAKQNNANKSKFDRVKRTKVAVNSKNKDEEFTYKPERDMSEYLFLLIMCFVAKEISEEEMFSWRASVNQ